MLKSSIMSYSYEKSDGATETKLAAMRTFANIYPSVWPFQPRNFTTGAGVIRLAAYASNRQLPS